MKIYDFAAFPNPFRVRLALQEKGVTDVEFVSIDVPNGEHRSPEFAAKNPSASVPVLELDCGTCISECTAITEYLDHAYQSGPKLTGQTPKERAVIHMMQRRAEQYVMDAVGTYFHHATPGLGPKLETNQNPEWGERQKGNAITGMRYFNGVLGDNAFVAGDDFSMADITLFCGLAFADFAKIEIPSECSDLIAWRQRVAARPSVQALS